MNPSMTWSAERGQSQLNQPHLSRLFTSLVSEIIPDLVRVSAQIDPSHSASTRAGAPGSLASPPTTSLVNQCLHSQAKGNPEPCDLTRHVEQCSRACLDLTADDFLVYAQDTLAAGLDIEVFYLDVIPKTVRLLHDLWERDEITFFDVTRATWIVKGFVLSGSTEFVRPDALTLTPMTHRFQAVVSMATGSQHTLGPLLVSQYLQRKGWNVSPGFDRKEKDLLQLVKTHWVDLFCVSVSTSSDLPGLQSLIKRVKSLSKNPDIQCLLGGPVVAWESDLQARMGVHGLCSNAREAHTLGLKLVRVHRKVRKLHALTAFELSFSPEATQPADQLAAPSNLPSTPSRKPNPLPASKQHKRSSRPTSNSRGYAQGVG